MSRSRTTGSVSELAEKYQTRQLALTATRALGQIHGDKRMRVADFMGTLARRKRKAESLNLFISQHDESTMLQFGVDVDKVHDDGGSNGVLSGIPFVASDNMNTSGFNTTCGAAGLASFEPTENAPVIDALIDAGGSLIGKTTVDELGVSGCGNGSSFGVVGNPYKPDAVAGGAAAGAAVAVASRVAPIAIGVDTDGDIRVPAALCGAVGFRSSFGRLSHAGVMPTCPDRDAIGTVTRSVADTQLVDAILSGESKAEEAERVPLTGARIGVVRGYFFDGVDPAVTAAVEATIGRLKEAGAEIVEMVVEGDVAALVAAAADAGKRFHFVSSVCKFLRLHSGPAFDTDVGPELAGPAAGIMMSELVASTAVSAASYFTEALPARAALKDAFAAAFGANSVDAILYPATTTVAQTLAEDATVTVAGAAVPAIDAYHRNSMPASLAGLPAITIPVALEGGLPIGVEFAAPAGTDARLLEIARGCEDVTPVIAGPVIAS